jgi:N-acetylneuraminate lyase
VIVQVGHNSLEEARSLAAHAQQAGADIVSATCPSYFKITSVEALIESMAVVAAGAPELPFYYYHIPVLTGSAIDMVEFMRQGRSQIPNLVGLKYTSPTLHEFQLCRELNDEAFDVVWGVDEMLLGALATGATAAIGSTYNIAAGLYRQLISAFQRGDLSEARRCQARSIEMIRTVGQYSFHPAMRSVLQMKGLDVGQCRLPLGRLDQHQQQSLRAQLEAIDFFQWSSGDSLPTVGVEHSSPASQDRLR